MIHLNPDLKWLVEQTYVADDGRSARVVGHEVSADSPSGLVTQIGNHYYVECHAGIVRTNSTPSMPGLIRDLEFEERLTAVTPHAYRQITVAVLETVEDKGIVFEYNGIRTYVDHTVVGLMHGGRARIAVPSLAPSLTPGFLFYTARGGAGHASRPLRLYVHLTNSDDAIGAWMRCLSWCEENSLPFRAKILSRSDSFPRRDALVVYAPTQMWSRINELARHLRTTSPFTSTRSLFTVAVEHGISAAWEPMDMRRISGQTSFGEHRSQVMARSLVVNRHLTGDALLRTFAADLMTANIDPNHPHRNLDSPMLLQSSGI